MATAYTTDWVPPYFQEIGFREGTWTGVPPYTSPIEKYMKNGKVAAASLCNTIASNQHWLALRDTDAINFLHNQTASDTTRARLLVNPFCEWVEFYFLVWKQFNGDHSTDPSYVRISCSDTSMSRTSNLISGGETSTKVGESNIPEAQWISFRGINDNLTAEDPGALKVRSTVSETWSGGEITVTTSSTCHIFAGFYRVVRPTITALVVET